MMSGRFFGVLALGLSAATLASCSGNGDGTDNRYGNADTAPSVLIRDLDVYRLVGNEEYVRIPISDDLPEGDAQKYFTADADNLYFDAAIYYRNGSVYYKILSSIRRDKEGNLMHAETGAVESAVNKTSSLFFRLGFLNEIDGREVTMPITGITVDPGSYTRMEGPRNAKGKKNIMLEYVGVISDVPPSMFKRMNAFDVTWVNSDQSEVEAAATDAVAPPYYDPAAAAAADAAAEPYYDPAYADGALPAAEYPAE